jgi:hypothetical protein
MKSYDINYRGMSLSIYPSRLILGGFCFEGSHTQTLGEALEKAVSYVDALHETKYHTIKEIGDAISSMALDTDKDGMTRMDYDILEILLSNYEPK